MAGVDALSPARVGVTRCGRTPGIPAPAFGSARRRRWLPRLSVVPPFANAIHRRWRAFSAQCRLQPKRASYTLSSTLAIF